MRGDQFRLDHHQHLVNKLSFLRHRPIKQARVHINIKTKNKKNTQTCTHTELKTHSFLSTYLTHGEHQWWGWVGSLSRGLITTNKWSLDQGGFVSLRYTVSQTTSNQLHAQMDTASYMQKYIKGTLHQFNTLRPVYWSREALHNLWTQLYNKALWEL